MKRFEKEHLEKMKNCDPTQILRASKVSSKRKTDVDSSYM